MALASWYARDPILLERSFQHLTPASLALLRDGIRDIDASEAVESLPAESVSSTYRVLAQAALRRLAHKQLDKYASVAAPEEVEAALKYHTLPSALQANLLDKYGGSSSPPMTWWDALERLREIAGDDLSHLWSLILDHPMTAYVPMQCQKCGHEVPDCFTNEDDSSLGLSEMEPDDSQNEVLEIRGGWFRGCPRRAVILKLDCPKCHCVTQWYRSSHIKIILNPNRWGRLCGEQEDLRLALASYLGIQVRTCVPLDWDHIWSEFRAKQAGEEAGMAEWCVQDDSARNFAARLDEGIGTWTGVVGIHPDPNLCQDLTNEYLSTCGTFTADTANGNTNFGEGSSSCEVAGRADLCFSTKMPQYRKVVGDARKDETGSKTQAKTVMGNLLEQAGLSSNDITTELRRAASENGSKSWWQV